MEQNKQSSRREFLGLATAAIAAVISIAMGITDSQHLLAEQQVAAADYRQSHRIGIPVR